MRRGDTGAGQEMARPPGRRQHAGSAGSFLPRGSPSAAAPEEAAEDGQEVSMPAPRPIGSSAESGAPRSQTGAFRKQNSDHWVLG